MSDIQKLVERWAAAELKGDVATLDQLIASDFQGIGPRGFVLDKAAWLERYQSGDLVNEEFDISEVAPRSYGTTAVVNAVQKQKSAYKGHPFPGNFRITIVAVQSGEAWEIVSMQLSQIADQQQAPQQ